MDAARFDRLIRSLAGASLPAGLARLLSGLVLGGSLGGRSLVTSDEAAARQKKPCPPCRKRKQGKCRGTLPEGSGCTDTAGRGGTCQSGTCVVVVLVPSPPSPPGPPGPPPHHPDHPHRRESHHRRESPHRHRRQQAAPQRPRTSAPKAVASRVSLRVRRGRPSTRRGASANAPKPGRAVRAWGE